MLPLMTRIDLQKTVEDKVNEWRKSTSNIMKTNTSYIHNNNNSIYTTEYVPKVQPRKNATDIERIKQKYTQNNKLKSNFIHVKPVDISPIKPERRRFVNKYIKNKNFSKSESDLTVISEGMELQQRNYLRYNFKNTENSNVRSSNLEDRYRIFDQKSILQIKSDNDDNYTTFMKERFRLSSQAIPEERPVDNRSMYSGWDSVSQYSRRKSLIAFDSDRISVSNIFRKVKKKKVEGLRKGYSEPMLNKLSLNDIEEKSPKKGWKVQMPVLRKGTFDCLVKFGGRRQKRAKDKIKEVDDGFFEKFGSILKEATFKAAEQECTPLAPLPDDTDYKQEPEITAKALHIDEAVPDSDSGISTTLDTDSEPDDEKFSLYGECVGWNIDELYAEILYEILHNVGGGDLNYDVSQQGMLTYVQEAFKITNDKHNELLINVEAKEPPEIMLNVEVLEAKQLVPKDPNGLSDPFVTLYLLSNASHRYNTSVKGGTLNPVWEEHFSLPIPENVNEDTLCIEVWDFDAAETVKEKMSKMFEVKGVKGFRKLMKEIVVTASTGKHDNELIGRANIPLKSIPAGGLKMWYNLDKRNKLQRRGVIQVRLAFSAQKNSQVAAQEHRHLLRILLLHELEHSKVAPYWWSGTFSSLAEAVLTQHVAQSGLSPLDNLLAQWCVYCSVTTHHPLSLSLFVTLFDKLAKPLKSGSLSKEDSRLFWDATRKLMPVCFNVVRKLRKKNMSDKLTLKSLKDSLQILSRLSMLDAPGDIELFPRNSYTWYTEGPFTVEDVLIGAIKKGAFEWFIYIMEGQTNTKDADDNTRMQNLIKAVQLVRSDLQKAVEYFDKLFMETMNISYAKILYGIYECKLAEIIEPEVKEVCKTLKRLDYSDEGAVLLAGGLNGGKKLGTPEVDTEPMAMGTSLFELYLALQRFLTLGQGLNEIDWRSYSIANFHGWFYEGVAQWLDIAVFKALTRIEKAMELDTLTPVDSSVKYSSSAVDTLAIFYQIKTFWQQLDWPDVEGSYTFVAKIIDDICRCCVSYSDKMSARVASLTPERTPYGEDKFEVTTEWCMAVNNMDYVCASLKPFVTELGLDKIVSNMCDAKSPLEAQRCKETLQNVMANAVDTVRNKIVELLEVLIKRMMPYITRFLLEGAEVLHSECASIDRVMRYLEENLSTLYNNMSEDNFARGLQLLWEQLAELLYELIQSNIEHRRPRISKHLDKKRLEKFAAIYELKRRPPSFFANLNECVTVMIKSFQQDEGGEIKPTCDALVRVQHLLTLHGLETQELIHQYHLERWHEQQNSEHWNLGQLTVRAQFTDNALHIEVMNARNLVATDSNGLCDSYVRIALLPEETFTDLQKPKTQTQNKTLFPLFDETFNIALTTAQRSIKDGLLNFIVKDKDLFSMSNQFLGEAYIHFSEIPAAIDTNVPTLSTLPQVHLNLSRPSRLEGDAIKALETRVGDKQAKEFLKKQKQKMVPPSNKQFFSLN